MNRTLRSRLAPTVFPILLLAFLLLGLPAFPAHAGSPARVQALRWRHAGDATVVTVRLSRPVRYRTTATTAGIAVDFWTAELDHERQAEVARGVAGGIRLRAMAPGVVRLGVDLRKPARFKVFSASDRLTITVFPKSLGTVPLPRDIRYRALRIRTGNGLAQVHVVTLDPRTPGLEIRPALGGAVVAATETTSTAATRLEAVAAINGNFYSGAGLPIGLIVIDGRVLSDPLPDRTVFGIDGRGRPWIGTVEFTGYLVTDTGNRIPISAVNRPPRAGGVALYTAEFGPLTPPQALIAVVRGGRVTGFFSGRPTIPTNGYALATAASEQHLLSNLVRNQKVSLRLTLSPPGLRHALQGGPRLVRNRVVSVSSSEEGFSGWFHKVRTARSAVGITRTGKVLFVTVDRRSRRNSGMNLPELADLMRRLGAKDAVNLDGGSSTTLVVGGRVVSALPKGGERTVSAMLVATRRTARR
jgi:uncharacterized protein YigE (DUF2233 family)